MLSNGWVIVREPNANERQALSNYGLNPDAMEILYLDGVTYARPINKALHKFVDFLVTAAEEYAHDQKNASV